MKKAPNVEDTTSSEATDTEDDDDIDVSGSEEEEEGEEAQRRREARPVQRESEQAANRARAAQSLPSLDGKPSGTLGQAAWSGALLSQCQCRVEFKNVTYSE